MSEEAIPGAWGALESALYAMNRAVGMTSEEGPGAAIEYLADFLNWSDGLDDALAERIPDDWLTRWVVVRADTLDDETRVAIEEPSK